MESFLVDMFNQKAPFLTKKTAVAGFDLSF